MLEELPNEIGTVLWQLLRDVMLWAGTPPEQRDELFSRYAARDTARVRSVATGLPIERSVRDLSGLSENPGADPRTIARACTDIAGWAEEREALQTAVAFAQDAALACPDDAEAAFLVARLATGIADHARAEIWFRRTIGLARQARDWRVYSRAFSGLGNLYRTRGNLPAAYRFHVRALRGARRGGLRAERAAALHDLFAIAVETGRTADAERFAREAVLAYGERNPRLAAFARDLAYHWMEQGQHARALSVFRAALPLAHAPVERLFVLACVMRAAAGAGQGDLARDVAREAWAAAETPEAAPGAPRALLEIGRGALQLGDLEMAEQAARRALQAGAERRDGAARLAADELLDAAGRARHVSPPRPAEPARARRSPRVGDALAEDLIRALHGLASRARPN